jgi:hypothetical protein
MISSGILSYIRITFNKEKRGYVWYVQVFSDTFRITFEKEKRGYVWYVQIFSVIFKLPLIKRNEDMCDIFRYSQLNFESPSKKRKDDMQWYLHVFSFRLEYITIKENRRCVSISSSILTSTRTDYD